VNEERLHAVVAAAVLSSEDDHLALLNAVVDVARSIFGARASSIFLFDEESDELIFEALSGEGSDRLVGTRFPSSTGVAGWVLVTRQPLILDDVSADPRFGRDIAEATGYVPRSLMAVPLLRDERVLGVLEVLDRMEGGRSPLHEMELLGLFGNQAAVALDLLQRARRSRAVLAGSADDIAAVARLAEAVDALGGSSREAGLRLLASLEEVIGRR
jgi:GAF domain-containing protein